MSALRAESAASEPRALNWERGLWGARRDAGVFGGSALAALGIIALGRVVGFGGAALPEWGFVVFVLGVDVAHVYATLFRTYFDGAELRVRPLRYVLTPTLAYCAAFAAYHVGSAVFWRLLAYLALFHFVRQEIGWLRLGRTKGGAELDARLDELALYGGALYPVLVWHTRLSERHFSWFVAGDFLPLPRAVAQVAQVAWLGVLALYILRQLWLFAEQGRVRPLPWLIVGKTALVWYVGIVLCNSDFDFTVSNVLAHGVPYFALLWSYARQRPRSTPRSLSSRIALRGLAAFLGTLLLLAFAEEWGWDYFVFHDRAWLFGAGPELEQRALGFLIPLLAVPQITHYALDAKLWRSAETRRLPAQQRALAASEGAP